MLGHYAHISWLHLGRNNIMAVMYTEKSYGSTGPPSLQPLPFYHASLQSSGIHYDPGSGFLQIIPSK